MRTKRHGQYLVEVTRFPLVLPVSCYLVVEDDGFTLIDTAIGGTGKRVVEVARKAEFPIARIALTHAHGDHAGSWDELHGLLPDAELLMSEREARLMAGDESLDPDEPQDEVRGGFVKSDVRPTRMLNPGDRVGSLDVVAAPGHTPGQIAFYDPREGNLIVGDAFYSRGGLAVAGVVRWLMPLPAFATWHKPTALETARKLREMNPTRMAVGHGGVTENPAPEMDKAITEAARKLGADESQVTNGPVEQRDD